MRDKTHMEQVEAWAHFVKNNDRSVWIKQIKPFIDSQVIKANQFYADLSKTEKGMKKVKQLRNLES